MGFRELARAHAELATKHNTLVAALKTANDEHTETRRALALLLGHWNAFVRRGFFGRLRWLVLGR